MPKLSPICIVTAPLLAPPAAQYLLALLWVSILCLFSPHLRAAEGIELSADSFTLATPSRPATTLLDAHFTLSQGNLGGALGICKPEPMFGVTPLVLKAHGLTGQFLEALATWKEVSTLLTDPQCERINAFFTRPKGASSQFNHHLCSPVVPVARHVDGRYEVVPTRVLTRKAGDIPWQHGQEHGPISPRQFIRPGETLLLENPEAAQPLQFIIHVLPAFNPQSKAATAAAGIGAVENVLLQPAGAQAIRADGPTSARIEGNTLVLTASNSGDRAQREIEQLPSWNLAVDMTQQRGLGLWVTGDNSGALVLVELGRRDYVLPIDFNAAGTSKFPTVKFPGPAAPGAGARKPRAPTTRKCAASGSASANSRPRRKQPSRSSNSPRWAKSQWRCRTPPTGRDSPCMCSGSPAGFPRMTRGFAGR